MGSNGNFPRLYPILDASFLTAAQDRAGFLRRLVVDLAEAGVGILQYRNKQGTETEVLADARVMREAAGSGMRLILNDWPELALAAGFNGVHVGQMDVTAAQARAIMGTGKIVGVSTHNEAQLRAADGEPVDYIAIGPVFATATKANSDPVVGLSGVRLARSITSKTLVAIGGISIENAAAVRQAGADSIAAISAIFSPGCDASKSAANFVRILENA
ncbi:MAG TPA: thiamine phosphate synthase [Candidatus Acidoferrales bacterium]|nr:thiamine phosphate synthase [Candidatus Acidoferrales bacterium]